MMIDDDNKKDVNVKIEFNCVQPIFIFLSLFLPSITFIIVLIIQQRRIRNRYLIKLKNYLLKNKSR